VTTNASIDSAGTANLAFLEELFAQYQLDPASVPADWQQYFASLTAGVPVSNGHAGNGQVPSLPAAHAAGQPPTSAAASVTQTAVVDPLDDDTMISPEGIATGHAVAIADGEVLLPRAPAGEEKPAPFPESVRRSAGDERFAFLQDRVDQLVRAYRVRGHLTADIDPLGRPRPGLPELDPSFYDLTEEDMDRVFSTDTIEGPQSMSLRQIIRRLHNTYCRSIGVQFMHMDDLLVRQWLRKPDSTRRDGHRAGRFPGHSGRGDGDGPSRTAQCACQHHGEESTANLP
jgi:2-oxoglutarate dehydrogenase E1 component